VASSVDTSRYVRCAGTAVQTPVRTYIHPRTGQTVTVVGAFPLGEPAYFRQLRALIDALEVGGAVVHCQGSPTQYEALDATPAEVEVLELDRCAAELTARRWAEAGWTDQHSGLDRPDSWHTVDLPGLQIIRQVGLDLSREHALRSLALVDWPHGDREGPDRIRSMIAALFRQLSTDQAVIDVTDAGPTDQVWIHQRNQTALAGIRVTVQDVVLLWGLAHLPGIEHGLTELGFEPDGHPHWCTVTEQRPPLPEAP